MFKSLLKKYSGNKLLYLLIIITFFILYNTSIITKEIFLNKSATVIVELRPVDPRSLMQGDYMILNFQDERNIFLALNKNNTVDHNRNISGVAVMQKTQNNVYKFKCLADKDIEPGPNEHLLKFHFRGRNLAFGGGSYFFQEGHQQAYALARYAELRVDQNGTAIITGLLDKNLVRIDGNTLPTR